jgi:hypothetical protein
MRTTLSIDDDVLLAVKKRAGDGFVATFTSPSVALDCAEAIIDAIQALGIEVRVGIHAGEVEVRGASPKKDVAGMAVHIGARVAALAGPSETQYTQPLVGLRRPLRPKRRSMHLARKGIGERSPEVPGGRVSRIGQHRDDRRVVDDDRRAAVGGERLERRR